MCTFSQQQTTMQQEDKKQTITDLIPLPLNLQLEIDEELISSFAKMHQRNFTRSSFTTQQTHAAQTTLHSQQQQDSCNKLKSLNFINYQPCEVSGMKRDKGMRELVEVRRKSLSKEQVFKLM